MDPLNTQAQTQTFNVGAGPDAGPRASPVLQTGPEVKGQAQSSSSKMTEKPLPIGLCHDGLVQQLTIDDNGRHGLRGALDWSPKLGKRRDALSHP